MMNMSNVIPLYDLFKGEMYDLRFMFIVVVGMVVILGVILWFNREKNEG